MLPPPRRSRVVLTVCLPLIAALTIGESAARELRPSVHGLTYQNLPAPAKKSPEMASFFGGSSFSSSPSSSSSHMPLPEAKNMSDPSGWVDSGGEGFGPAGLRRGKDHDRVRDVLLVASLACGITGVALLLVATLLFIFQLRVQRSSTDNPPPLPPPLPPPPPTSTAIVISKISSDSSVSV